MLEFLALQGRVAVANIWKFCSYHQIFNFMENRLYQVKLEQQVLKNLSRNLLKKHGSPLQKEGEPGFFKVKPHLCYWNNYVFYFINQWDILFGVAVEILDYLNIKDLFELHKLQLQLVKIKNKELTFRLRFTNCNKKYIR